MYRHSRGYCKGLLRWVFCKFNDMQPTIVPSRVDSSSPRKRPCEDISLIRTMLKMILDWSTAYIRSRNMIRGGISLFSKDFRLGKDGRSAQIVNRKEL